MKLQWRKILTVAGQIGLNVIQGFLPSAISDVIDQVEDQATALIKSGQGGWSGPEKQSQALEIMLKLLAVKEGLDDGVIRTHPKIEAVGRELIDNAHQAKLLYAKFAAAIAEAKGITLNPEAATTPAATLTPPAPESQS
jgi:hypothetical protein